MKTNLDNVSGNITDAVDGIGQQKLVGIQFETADPRLLDVRDGDFNDHVSMQPAAIAYYGMLKKTAARNLEAMKRAYDRWQKKTYANVRQGLINGGTAKPTVNDIEASVLMTHEATLVKYETDIDKLQDQYDTLEAWYEAWRQKSYSLREHADLLSDERHTMPYIRGTATETQDGRREDRERDKNEGISNVKNILRRSRELSQQKGGT
jgi:hypothetical protein